ncbi:magnesium transporter MgtE N-terminal domain-containing protein [Anaeromyxobacter paludicola]|uniref:Membrane protein n=1 Tax=Anaeromyxobacter paludicola TaxID=2918171 RepID=A0ABM7X8H1_9BACT|nr:CBS domain-containing protein [Anaeromyxobacter paludicola]BDG08144.1 membrane protein [Anaeromyxobacter paludicola]
MPQKQASQEPRFLYLSELLGAKVRDAAGRPLGRVSDAVVATSETYPPVEAIVVRRGGERVQLPWTAIRARRAGQLEVDATAAQAFQPASAADRIRLVEEILDQQIVDVEGAKVVRVNDLHFLSVKGALRLVHVDVGFRGLVRRMGWERAVDGAVRLVRPQARYLEADQLLSWKLVQPLSSAPGKVRIDVAQRMLADLHPSDLAEIMEDLDRQQRTVLFDRLDVETAAEALEEASPEVTTQLLEGVSPEKAADILEEMAPDEAADVLAELPGETRRELLEAMERPEAHEVRQLLEYHPRSAGGLMTTDLVELRRDTTAAEALAEVRRRADELPILHEIFVTTGAGRLEGICTLKDLVSAEPADLVGKLMREVPATVVPEAELRDLAEAASKYNMVSVPVVDEAGELKGIVTVDDILSEVLGER